MPLNYKKQCCLKCGRTIRRTSKRYALERQGCSYKWQPVLKDAGYAGETYHFECAFIFADQVNQLALEFSESNKVSA